MEETWIDGTLFAFDGRVMEVFGFPGEGNRRYHVRNLKLTIDPPDPRGRRRVAMRPWSTAAGGLSMHVSPEAWPCAERFLADVAQAIGASQQPRAA